jgi:hypothetical protein
MYATVRRYEGVTDPSEAGRRVNDYTTRCNRNEGCVDPIGDDRELSAWLDSGWYGYISPQSQFDFDDDLEKAINPWPWNSLIGELLLAKRRICGNRPSGCQYETLQNTSGSNFVPKCDLTH